MAQIDLATSDSTTVPLPSPAQIALALSLLKSKPENLSAEDYISTLRERLVPGRRPHSNDRNLDSATFWRVAYENGEAEQTRLRNRIYELEEQSLSKADMRESAAALEQPRKGKRKLDEIEGIKANSRTKRIATTPHPTMKDDSLEDELLDAGKSREGNLTLLRALANLRRALAKTSSNPKQLVPALRAVCISATSALADPECTAHSHAAPQLLKIHVLEDHLYCNICVALSRIYPSILQVLDYVGTLDVDEDHLRSSISHVSSLFKTLLSHLSSFVIEIAQLRRQKPRSRSKSKIDTPQDADYMEICQHITRLAICMTTTLDLNRRAHCKLFEALMCLFLDRLGSTLSLLVFASASDPGSKSQSKKLQLGVLPPQGLQDRANIDHDIAVTAAEIEAPLLVIVVKKTLRHLEEARYSASLPLPREVLLRTIGEKLQNTLLRGIFGDEDDNFRKALRRPHTPDPEEMDGNCALKSDQSISSWFISEIWSQFGWGTLAGHIISSTSDPDPAPNPNPSHT